MSLKRSKKGFTLVELIVVIAIVAISVVISVASYIAFVNKGNETADIYTKVVTNYMALI